MDEWDDDAKLMTKIGCGTCLALIVVVLGFWVAFVYGTIEIIQALS